MKNGFLLFHHNLNFSSIEVEHRPNVISKCYWPLLLLAEELSVPINVELPGWTLEQVAKIDPLFISRLRGLINSGLVEIIGSGYAQVIGPLFPCELNRLNLQLGQEVYDEILGVVPRVALINEKAVSGGLLDVYIEAGFERIVMEGDNVALAHGFDDKKDVRRYSRLRSASGSSIDVTWSDSIFFQKFQRAAHCLDSLDYYIHWLKDELSEFIGPIPIYSNDVEVFDFRPGRFAEEERIDGCEWSRINRMLEATVCELELRYFRLSDLPNHGLSSNTLHSVNSVSYPVPVKKQPKYNLARWAVSGRADQEINTRVYRLIKLFTSSPQSFSRQNRKLLCHLCASDFRTHITEKRWRTYLNKLSCLERDFKIDNQVRSPENPSRSLSKKKYSESNPYLIIQDEECRLKLNTRKGLAIEQLSFRLDDRAVSIRSYPHGHFKNISFGADFYSGAVLIESLTYLRRYTDLSRCETFYTDAESDIAGFVINRCGGLLSKEVGFCRERTSMIYRVNGKGIECGQALFRIGNFLFTNVDTDTIIRFTTGGVSQEQFLIDRDLNHASAVSTLVSSTTGMGAPDGWVEVLNKTGGLRLSWDNSLGFLYPMLINRQLSSENFCRLVFSLSEVDDTSKPRTFNFNTEILVTPVFCGSRKDDH